VTIVFERMAASWELAKSSWRVIRTDKKLLIFPILSGLCCLLITLSFALPFIVQPQLLDNLQQNQAQWVLVVLGFAFYFCTYFAVIFFNAALISCALIRFNGGEPTLGDGLRAAGSRLPQILAWALVSATVGMVLKAIENAHEQAGKWVSALLGAAWTIMTYFVVPVLVVEKLGPFQSISRSVAILKKTWGEALVGGWGIGLFTFVLFLPFLVLFVVGLVLCFNAAAVIGWALLGVAVIYFLWWLAVCSALSTIFRSALYQYAAHGIVPNGFEERSMEGAFKAKGA
jgi:hypothetical protein